MIPVSPSHTHFISVPSGSGLRSTQEMLASPPVAVVRGRQALISSSYTSCSDPSMISWRVALK